jgi:methenyltetrahydrofolate cyclohydrolase
MLVDQSVRGLLDAFRSPDPTPGGGSASALASAVGASLLLMVAALPKTRNGTDDDRDTAAYDRVVAAYRMAKASPEEQAARKAAIQRALQGATDVPLGVMQRTVRALEAATAIAVHGYKSASSDVGVAIALLTAGATGAKLNVDVNLEAISDGAYRDRVGADARDLLETAGALAGRADALLR